MILAKRLPPRSLNAELRKSREQMKKYRLAKIKTMRIIVHTTRRNLPFVSKSTKNFETSSNFWWVGVGVNFNISLSFLTYLSRESRCPGVRDTPMGPQGVLVPPPSVKRLFHDLGIIIKSHWRNPGNLHVILLWPPLPLFILFFFVWYVCMCVSE